MLCQTHTAPIIFKFKQKNVASNWIIYYYEQNLVFSLILYWKRISCCYVDRKELLKVILFHCTLAWWMCEMFHPRRCYSVCRKSYRTCLNVCLTFTLPCADDTCEEEGSCLDWKINQVPSQKYILFSVGSVTRRDSKTACRCADCRILIFGNNQLSSGCNWGCFLSTDEPRDTCHCRQNSILYSVTFADRISRLHFLHLNTWSLFRLLSTSNNGVCRLFLNHGSTAPIMMLR